MASVEFKFSRAGYAAVCDMGGVQSMLERKAQSVASSATRMLDPDEGYRAADFEVKRFTTKTGATGRVVRTKTDHARHSQARNKTLTKALKGG